MIFILFYFLMFSADGSDDGVGICGFILTGISWLLVLVTLPFSLCVCFKVSIMFLVRNVVISVNRRKVIHFVLHSYHLSFRWCKSTRGLLYFDSVDFLQGDLEAQVNLIKLYHTFRIPAILDRPTYR